MQGRTISYPEPALLLVSGTEQTTSSGETEFLALILEFRSLTAHAQSERPEVNTNLFAIENSCRFLTKTLKTRKISLQNTGLWDSNQQSISWGLYSSKFLAWSHLVLKFKFEIVDPKRTTIFKSLISLNSLQSFFESFEGFEDNISLVSVKINTWFYFNILTYNRCRQIPMVFWF